MNNAIIFQKVANREITPEEAAELMAEQDREARRARRPAWLPQWAWMLGAVVIACLCAIVGVRNES